MSFTVPVPSVEFIFTSAVSLFTTVAVILEMLIPLYLGSLEVALWLMVTLRSLLWSTSSSTPVTVTVCAVSQVVVVKVKVAGLTVATVTVSEDTVMATLSAGLLFSTIV